MQGASTFFVGVWIKLFFLFAPFFALSVFLSMTGSWTEARRRWLALQVVCAVGVICLALFFFGRSVFALFGITLDAFRTGAGGLLFLAAAGMVSGKPTWETGSGEDIAVVPLALPMIVGPATIGALLVLGAEISDVQQRVLGCLALLLAVACVGILLLLGSFIERGLGRRGITILSKVTGVIVAAIAAQMILSGVQHFFAAGVAGGTP